MAARRIGPGRPALPASERRSRQYAVRLTPREARGLAALAEAEGTTVSTYLQALVARHLARKGR